MKVDNDVLLLGLRAKLHDRIQNDMDAVIIVEGEEGSGKSSLAIWAGRFLSLQFLVEENIVYSLDSALDKIYSLEKGGIVVWDEACYDMSRRDAMTKGNKDIVKTIMATRSRNIIHFICIPHKEMLESYMEAFRSVYVFDVYMRGKKRGFFNILYPKKCFDKHGKPYTRWVPLVQQMRFPRLPRDVDAEYKAYKEQCSRARLVSVVKEKQPKDDRLKTYLFMRQDGYTDGQIATELGITPSALSQWRRGLQEKGVSF